MLSNKSSKRNKRNSKPKCTNTFQEVPRVKLANVQLVKANHKAKSRVNVERDYAKSRVQSHDSLGTITVKTLQTDYVAELRYKHKFIWLENVSTISVFSDINSLWSLNHSKYGWVKYFKNLYISTCYKGNLKKTSFYYC